MQIMIKSLYPENVRLGQLLIKKSVRGERIISYQFDLRHTVLHLHKSLSASEISILQDKVDTLVASWDEKFEQHERRCDIQSAKDAADMATEEAQVKIDELQHILTGALSANSRLKWDELKYYAPHPVPKEFPKPKPISYPTPKPAYVAPKIKFWHVILGQKSKKISSAEINHANQVKIWLTMERLRIDEHLKQEEHWVDRRNNFLAIQRAAEVAYEEKVSTSIAMIDALQSDLKLGEPTAIVDWATMVIDASEYSISFVKECIVQYKTEDELLLIGYDLPCIANLPSIKSVKFNKATSELKKNLLTEREQKSNFDSVLYQISLRTLHELFFADEWGHVNKILFNGYVNYVDQANGQDTRSCLLSVLVDRATFCAIDLSRVDPKTCFKSLKGVSASCLAALAPIPPVMEMNKEDDRFVEGHCIADGLCEGTNLAGIHWEEFEHLIRELFEKEFMSRGGEVKVTQASHDGGVDAIAFDPDPITGGKIVIQAKRYTRTVGVSAVRDLFGTVMNEGASKGILVTTADFGPDAYHFASGKPLTLMNGANLLYLMERHGYNARINIQEARRLVKF